MSRSPSRSVSRSPRSENGRKSRSLSRSRSRTPPAHYKRSGNTRKSSSRSHSKTPPVHKRERKSPSRSRSRSRDSRTPPIHDYHRRSRESRRSRSPHSSRRPTMGMGERGAPVWKKRDSPDPSRCLGVFNLSMDTTEKDLRETFEEYGEIEKIDLIYDRMTGQSRGFGFIYFERLGDASKAREKMNGIEIDGRTIRIDYSLTKRAHSPTPGQYQGAISGGRGRGGFGGYGGGGRGYGGDRYDRGRGGYDRGYDGYGGGRSRRSPSPRRRSPSYERDRSRERY